MEVTGEKKTAQGGLEGDRCSGPSQQLDQLLDGRCHVRLSRGGGCRLTPCIGAVVVVACSLIAPANGLAQTAAAPPDANGQRGILVCGADENWPSRAGDSAAHLGKDGHPSAAIVPMDCEPVPDQGARQERQQANQHPVAVDPVQQFVSQHGLLWAALCFVLGLVNGGAFGWPYRRFSFAPLPRGDGA